MTFSTLLPLGLLVLVPYLIILYFLRPRGKDTKISSNLLWKQIFERTQSRTKRSRFVRDLLLLLQLLIIAMLILSLMGPRVRSKYKNGSNILILMDTSAGMQHKDGDKTRFEKAVDEAVNLVDDSDGASFTVISCGGNVDIKISNSKNRTKVKEILKGLKCTDEASNLTSAYEVVKTMRETGGDDLLHVIIFTDGSGAETAGEYVSNLGADVKVYGGGSSNLSAQMLTFANSDKSTVENPLYDFAGRIINYSDSQASFEVTLYDEDGTVCGVQILSCEGGISATAIFNDVSWNGNKMHIEISDITFSNGGEDSLEKDNETYVVKDKKNTMSGVLIGQGNIFIEKAFEAVTKKPLIVSTDETVIKEKNAGIIIYDSGFKDNFDPAKKAEQGENVTGIMEFGIPEDSARIEKKLEGVYIDSKTTALTNGLSNFNLGVNEAAVLKVPEWAESFMDYNGESVGYFGEHDGIRYIVLGFDIRETDFPLNAEFPIFIANSMNYLSDSGILVKNTYTAGDVLLVNPSADYDAAVLSTKLTESGVFDITAGNDTESYVVRFPSSEADGRAVSEGTVSTGEYKNSFAKRNISGLLVIAAIILLLLEMIIYVKEMRYKGKFYYILRGAMAALLILSQLHISIPVKAVKQTTIFVVDVSESNKDNIEEINKYISKEVKKMSGKDRFGVVAFGDESIIDQFVTKDKSYAGVMTEVDTQSTNIEEAVSRGLSMIPPESSGRIVILTDGKETEGNIMNTASAVVGGEVELYGIIFEKEEQDDVYIENATLPEKVSWNETFSVNVNIMSNYDTEAEVFLEDDNGNKQKAEIQLVKGNNRYTFKSAVDEESTGKYKITVNAKGDENLDNNVFNLFTAVGDEAPVLVVIGGNTHDDAFESVLKAAGVNYETVSASTAPDNINELLAYESIIFDNVFKNDLPEGFLANIESYVKDYGHGFICCGGENSFMLGGYKETVLEKILPVNMNMRGMVEYPETAVIMVIDRSGSMGGNMGGVDNLEVAKNAAIVAVDSLSPSDYVGVVSFDDKFTWDVPITRVSEKESIVQGIKNIGLGGGTTIHPAVRDAVNKAIGLNCKVKHILLLTDGMGEGANYDDVIQDVNDNNITLSTIAIGGSADIMLLSELAAKCGGRYYNSTSAKDIPRIFTQEVYLSMNSYIQNGDFRLDVSPSHAITKGLFSSGWPSILGYIAATPKDMATVLAVSDQDDPILSCWQYGLGKTIAWNTDVSGKWSSNLEGESDYAALWKRIVDFSINDSMSLNDKVESHEEDGKIVVTYTTNDFNDKTEISGGYTGGEDKTGDITFQMIEPGIYQAVLPEDTQGIYNLNVVRKDDGKIVNSVLSAAVLQYPKEYRYDISNRNFTDYIEKYGKNITMNDNIWKSMNKKHRDRFDLTWIIVLLSLLLFTADVTLRKFGFMYFPLKKKKKVKTKVNSVEAEIASNAAANAAGAVAGTGAAGGNAANTVDGNQGAQAPSGNAAGAANPKKAKKAKKEKDVKTQTTGLDMSELLKKKNDRNMQ